MITSLLFAVSHPVVKAARMAPAAIKPKGFSCIWLSADDCAFGADVVKLQILRLMSDLQHAPIISVMTDLLHAYVSQLPYGFTVTDTQQF